MVINGPTGSGKSTWLRKLLKTKNFDEDIGEIHYFYGVWQPEFEQMEKDGVQFHKGLSDVEKLEPKDKTQVIIIDDLQEEACKDLAIQYLFTKHSHHNKLMVIFLTQNLFNQGKCARTISLNTHYLVLFKNPRDVGQIKALGTQMGVNLASAYKDATSSPFGYLVIDTSPNPPSEETRYRSQVFDDYPVVWI